LEQFNAVYWAHWDFGPIEFVVAAVVTNILREKNKGCDTYTDTKAFKILSFFKFCEFFLISNLAIILWTTCVTKVEPQRIEWNRKMSSPLGSPISSAKWWNVDRGTTIRRRQYFICVLLKNAPYSLRHRCTPVNHSTVSVKAEFHYAGRRAASHQDSVMEYGLNRSTISTCRNSSKKCLRQVRNQVCDLDSVMEFSQTRSQTSLRTSSRARSRAR